MTAVRLAPVLVLSAAQHPACEAVIIIPARNEEEALPATLEALRRQVELDGTAMQVDRFEVLLLLNNCTDRSLETVRHYGQQHPYFNLHVLEATLAEQEAHVGTARRLLMDLACERLETNSGRPDLNRVAILSTDADTLVAPDWIASNLAEIQQGADVVGGVIHLFPEELDALNPGTRNAYERDRRLQCLVAQLEAILDPDPADPWPRHLEHFGASLACTASVYRRSGGMPPVKPLEDVAFINALRRVGARIRHSPRVHIQTSARLDGRAEVGLSGQLRHWQRETAEGTPHLVTSCQWMEFRFTLLGRLRRFNESSVGNPALFPEGWAGRLIEAHQQRLSNPAFLERVDAEALIHDAFDGPREAEITGVLADLALALQRLKRA